MKSAGRKSRLTRLPWLFVFALAINAAPVSQVPGAAASQTKGREYVYQMDPIPAGLLSARFHLWIPETAAQAGGIRGVIAQSGYNYGLTTEIFRSVQWRALASELGMALYLHRAEESDRKHAGSPGSRAETVAALLAGLKHFASVTRHPELQHSGLILTGASASGRQAIFLGNSLPQRTIAVVVYSPATTLPNPLATSVPVLINMGGLDLKHGNPINLNKLILAARAQGAPWAGLFEANVPHAGHGEPSFVMDWIRAMMSLRVPAEIPLNSPVPLRPLALDRGWLARLNFNSDLSQPHPEGPNAAVVSDFAGAKPAADSYWLPDERLALAWKEHCLRPDVSFRNGVELALSNASFTNSIGMKLVAIPPGRFIIGSPPDEEKRADDEVQHEVMIGRTFFMGATEVTQAQWQKVMGSNPATYKADTYPVEGISYDDARQFCRRLSQLEGRTYRLPTEAEWEYACRAGTTTPFNSGWSIDPDIANYRGDVGYGGGAAGIDRRRPHPVRQFPPNAWGLYDMHGNVFEWCDDWYGPYPDHSTADPKGPAQGTQRVFRGGSWYNLPHIVRSAFRGMSAPSYTSRLVGLRVVVDVQ